MSATLDVAVGLVFVYLVLSLLCSAIAEAIEHYFRYRADYLRQGIEKLLLGQDPALLEKLYAHPLIASLHIKSRLEGLGRSGGPSYIPSRQFVLALLDVAKEGTAAGDGSVAHLKTAVDANAALPASLKKALGALIDDAGSDVEKLKTNIALWFDGSMDRVAGWYKRRAQFVLLFVGVLATVVVNADTLSIVSTLSNDSVVRQAVVTAAEEYLRTNPPKPVAAPPAPAPPAANEATPVNSAATPEPPPVTSMRESVTTVTKQLGTLGLPVGWRWQGTPESGGSPSTPGKPPAGHVEDRIVPTSLQAVAEQLFAHALGWLLTAIAVSFGAPFWFDILNKVMVIRSTVKPREKSREEGSEDRADGSARPPVRIEVAAAKP